MTLLLITDLVIVGYVFYMIGRGIIGGRRTP